MGLVDRHVFDHVNQLIVHTSMFSISITTSTFVLVIVMP